MTQAKFYTSDFLGEELGLLGSQAVALHYKRQKKQYDA